MALTLELTRGSSGALAQKTRKEDHDNIKILGLGLTSGFSGAQAQKTHVQGFHYFVMLLRGTLI